jgi:hypothetical protein
VDTDSGDGAEVEGGVEVVSGVEAGELFTDEPHAARAPMITRAPTSGAMALREQIDLMTSPADVLAICQIGAALSRRSSKFAP